MIKLDERKIFTGSTTGPALDRIVVINTLMRDLFAVANPLVVYIFIASSLLFVELLI